MNARESQIMNQITDYLDLEMAAGRIYWDRLNAGEMLAHRGQAKYRVKLCRPGTADLIVLQNEGLPGRLPECRIIYLEVKRPGEDQNPEQKTFQVLVEYQGAEYHVVHNADEVQAILS